ncbi:unnamed protein product [Linum trigynum]|uniref:Uncharacterized protein n=1 Tax=Linum trigynum TaxID=586398 RepID=A0AAV2E6N4_9ROSI
MAPRWRNQEGDVSAGFVEEQVANIEHGQASDAVTRVSGGAEILVVTTPIEDLGEAVGALRQMMEENRKMLAENCQALKENRKMMVENCLALEENRQVMEENRRCMEKALEATNKIISQLDCFYSSFDRRVDKILKISKNDARDFGQLLIKPVSQSMVLLQNGLEPTPNNKIVCKNLSPSYGRYTQPRTENLLSPVATQPPPLREGCGERSTSTLNNSDGVLHVQGDVQSLVLETRSDETLVNGRDSEDPLNVEQVPPHAFPPPKPPLLSGQIGDSDGLKTPRAQQGGHESLISHKLTPRCPSGGHVVSKSSHQSQACAKHINLAKSGKGGMPPTTCSGHGGISNKSRREKAIKSYCRFENLAKYGQDMSKKPYEVQVTHVCDKHANLTKFGQGSMSPTMKNGVEGIFKKTQQVKPPHGFCKREIMDKGGLGGKSMSMNSKYSTPTTKSGHGGMYKKSPYTPAKHGCTKNQWWLSAKCRGQQGLYVERRRQESYTSGCRLVKPRPGLQHREEIKHVSSGRKSRQKNNHDSLDMSSKVAQAKKHDTSCKATKTRHANNVPPISKLENSNLMYEDSPLMEEKSHVVYGWHVWFDPWTWQWVYTFGTLIVAKGYVEQ